MRVTELRPPEPALVSVPDDVPLRRAIGRPSLLGIGVAGGLAMYALVQWLLLRPDAIEGWRETDTQTIARHFTEPGANLFRPRIDWGGAGPGFVETEFQGYPGIVSLILRITGPSAEWPGRFVSLVAVLAAGWVVYRQLGRRYGQLAGALGAAALLTTRSVVQTATAVQPESLCLLLFVIAWFALREYVDSDRRTALAVYAVAGALAMLVKPTAGQLGIASVIVLFFASRDVLRRKEIWLAWGFMVGLLVLHLWHARTLYLDYGNTFGVLSGGESKIPRLEVLFTPRIVWAAVRHAVTWGIGPVGTIAVVAAVYLKRRSPRELVPIAGLLAGVVVWTLLALRYTSSSGGDHYHVLGGVLAAEAVACVIATLPARPAVNWQVWTPAFVALVLALQFAQSYDTRLLTRDNPFDAAVVAVAEAAEPYVAPGSLVVVRSVHPSYDDFWQDEIQFADPRVFYLTGTRGWPMAKDVEGPEELEAAARQGAAFYLEPEPRDPLPRLDAWLSEHAELLATSPLGGRVFAVTAP